MAKSPWNLASFLFRESEGTQGLEILRGSLGPKEREKAIAIMQSDNSKKGNITPDHG